MLSGPNVIFFGSAPATFTVKDITLASDQTNLKLTFGGQYYDSDNNDNNFNKDNFVVYLSANGTDYTPLSYEVNDGDQVDPYWVFATKNFTLKNATSTLYIKFEAKASSKFRLDDITLMTGNGGEEIDLAGGGVVPPDRAAMRFTRTISIRRLLRRSMVNGRSWTGPTHGRMLPVRVIRR